MAKGQLGVPWGEIRTAFVERSDRPTYTDLSGEFSVPLERISKVANDEGWPMLRARHSAALVERSGAHDMLLQAAAAQRAVTDRLSSLTLQTISQLQSVVDDPHLGELAPSTRSQVLNTAAFALANLAKGLKDAGVVGLPRALMDSLESKAPKGPEGKDWLKHAMQQINVTVQLAREGKPVDTVPPQEPKAKATAADPIDIPSYDSQDGKEVARLIREAEARSLAKLEAEGVI